MEVVSPDNNNNNKQPLTLIPEDSMYVFNCPHCLGTILVHTQEVNCHIFRHAVLKSTAEQINPHAPKEELDQLAAQQLIYGCGLPFQITGQFAEACGYI